MARRQTGNTKVDTVGGRKRRGGAGSRISDRSNDSIVASDDWTVAEHGSGHYTSRQVRKAAERKKKQDNFNKRVAEEIRKMNPLKPAKTKKPVGEVNRGMLSGGGGKISTSSTPGMARKTNRATAENRKQATTQRTSSYKTDRLKDKLK